MFNIVIGSSINHNHDKKHLNPTNYKHKQNNSRSLIEEQTKRKFVTMYSSVLLYNSNKTKNKFTCSIRFGLSSLQEKLLILNSHD